MNASLLPPCEAELASKLRRTSFIARMWAGAHRKEINTEPSENDGFKLRTEGYEPIWHEGPMLPPTLVVEEESLEEDEDEYAWEDSSSDDSEQEDF